ncbi:hypothetical protein VKT23_005331 [Stygiomarasmius scandens]|uniref:Uncharacterized protein n=1 Tax=Marasmiellus scandens TaxID=2682957 RepID=A0ABR1JSQ4_9AGAR
MSRTDIELQLGPKPDWELSENQEGLHDISTSAVLLYALKQSREKWLSSNFTKLSGKAARGKTVDNPTLPPYTIHACGKCDLEIGPHFFYDTLFYEAHYTPTPTQSPYSSQWSSTTASNTSAASSSSFSASSLSSISPVAMITPALINKVNDAAASNPTLSNLLQVAAAGKANDDQLKTLGLLIQSLPQVSTHAANAVPPREFDLVLEFREALSERWILPRGTSACERNTDSSADACDITLTCHTTLNRPASNGETSTHVPQNDPQLFTLKFNKAPVAVWDTLLRWVGGEQKNRENLETLSKVKEKPTSFLAYHLPDGPLLEQLKAATASPYTMKPVKPTASATSSRSRRRPSQKKLSEKPSEGSTVPSRRKSADTTKTITQGVEKDATPAPKKPRQSKARGSAVQIRCLTCNQADVPLMLGGRFCRPCVESGKANPSIPQTQGALATSYVPMMYASPVLTRPGSTTTAPATTPTSTASVTQTPSIPATS